jgi:hypothetical protein
MTDYYDEDWDWEDDEFERYNFRDPGGHSALRGGERRHPCPTCLRENMLSDHDMRLGYQCDYCADALEGRYGMEY